jgi:hypothetical protein
LPGACGSSTCRITPVILSTLEAEIRRLEVQSQSETLSQKNPSQKRAGGVAQEGPVFKPQYRREKNKQTAFKQPSLAQKHGIVRMPEGRSYTSLSVEKRTSPSPTHSCLLLNSLLPLQV